MSVTALPSWLAGRAPPGPRPRMRIQRDAKLRVFPFRRFTGATSSRHHPTGRCRHDCEHLAGLHPDHAQPWPALPCHDVTIALDDPIATLGRASPRRRVAFFSNGFTLASLPLNVLLGRLVTGLGGAWLGSCNWWGLVELRLFAAPPSWLACRAPPRPRPRE